MVSSLPDIAHGLAYCAAGFVLLTVGGNAACRALLDRKGLTNAMRARRAAADKTAADAAQAHGAAAPAPAPEVGALIGSFERSLLALGLLTGSWEVLAGVVALKTIARFKELDERLDAEYFLVGSLFSLIWTVAVTALWLGYDLTLGNHLSTALTAVVGPIKGG